MNAEIVSVGTELLLGQIIDTHAPTMARILAECGIGCTRRQTVGDNLLRIEETFREALGRSDIVVAIGGLGPTEDDLTRDAIARVLGLDLETVPEMEEKLRAFFEMRRLPWSDTILRQAQRPAGARLIENPNGTAPGLICEKDGKVVIALPGPRGEFNPMASGPVREYLSTLSGGEVIHSRVLRICGMGESHVEERIRHLTKTLNPTVAPYAHPGEVHLRLTAKAGSREDAQRLIDPLENAIRRELGTAVFGVDDVTLEQAILYLLRSRSETVAVAESVTGGGIGSRLTSVPGSSAAFLGGVISYNAKVKQDLLGVSAKTLESHTPVSGEVAAEMAQGARHALGATYAVAATGNAGPDVDEGGKAVGLVYLAVAHPGGVEVEEHRFRGLREDIRGRASQFALILLRNVVLGATG